MFNVSVITPCYKGNRYLHILRGILCDNQNYAKRRIPDFRLEWIVVNDYPKEPVDLRLPDEELSIKILNHKHNQGIHQARVTGLSHASGKYIIFLDQDDTLSEEAIYESYRSIGSSDLLIENAWLEDLNGEKTLLYQTRGAIKNALSLGPYLTAHNQIVSPGHCLIRRNSIPEAWTRNILKVNGSDDLYLWLLMFGCGAKIQFINKPYYTHKYTGINLSENERNMAQSSLLVAKYLKESGCFSPIQIKRFVKSREMRVTEDKKNKTAFFKMLAGNIDIIFLRGLWKFRAVLIR